MATAAGNDKRAFPERAVQALLRKRRAWLDQAQDLNLLAQHWPVLAAKAGLKPTLPAAHRLLSRTDRTGKRLVLALSSADGTALIFKYDGQSEPGHEGHFARSIAAQRIARVRMQGNLRGLRVPRVLAELPEACVALMEAAPGQQAAALIETATDNVARRLVLTACGRWLSGFHAASKHTRRSYRTHFVLSALAERRASLLRGQLKACEVGLLVRLVTAVEESADAHEGKMAAHGQQHGDFTLRNLLIADNVVSAIDFRPEHRAPVGYDVMRFLVDYVTLFGDHRKIRDGRLLASADRAAFFAGYDLAKPNDAAIDFLAGVQLIHDWLKLPADPARHSLLQTLRLSGLRESAMRLFPQLRSD